MQSCVKQGLTGSQSGTAKLSRNWTGGVQGEATDRLILSLRLVALLVLSRAARGARGSGSRPNAERSLDGAGRPFMSPIAYGNSSCSWCRSNAAQVGSDKPSRISVPSSRENWAGCWLTSTCKPGLADGLMHLRRELGEGLSAAAQHFRRPDYRAKIVLQRTD